MVGRQVKRLLSQASASVAGETVGNRLRWRCLVVDNREYRDHRLGRLRIFGAALVIAFAVTLTMVVGSRLSNEALSVLAGAVCGVGVAIPTSLVILSVSRRRSAPLDQPVAHSPRQPRAYPPVVVVSPPAQQTVGGWSTLPTSMAAPAPRHFTVVGASPFDQDVLVDEPSY